MFMNADMPVTRVVLLGVQAEMIGSPAEGYPAGLFSRPAKRVAKKTEMKVKKAEKKPSLESILKVRGKEPNQLMIVTIAAKSTVRHAWIVSASVMVFI